MIACSLPSYAQGVGQTDRIADFAFGVVAAEADAGALAAEGESVLSDTAEHFREER